MTATTLTPEDLMQLFVAELTASTVTGSFATNEIRQANWLNTEFTYPALRIDDDAMDTAIEFNGNCWGEWFDIRMSLYVYTQDASNKTNRNLMGVVGQFFMRAQLVNARVRTMPLRVDYISPVLEDERLWRGQVVVSGLAKEVIP